VVYPSFTNSPSNTLGVGINMEVISVTAYYVLLFVTMLVILAAVALVGQILLGLCFRKGRTPGAR